ncbi:hypothetical protein LIER_08333 [Lithospermum erythrorhizon]|uniref:Mitochondrial protein n=1 Tax=Lithospermum erythrorhizon TaxID=34254 RepID=A0AAV3PBN3_LITER
MKMEDTNTVATPLPHDWHSHDPDSPLIDDPAIYRRLVGRLLYLNFTRPDLTYIVHYLSQFMQNPTQVLQAYCDSDWAKCPTTRRSTTGYCIMLGNALVSWKSKKQLTVACSSSKAEYRSATAPTCEFKWISYVLKDMEQFADLPIPLNCDKGG